MQESLFFDNQIIKPSNLDFMNDSTSKNVKDAVTAFTRNQPGVVAGLEITGSGSAIATVTNGYGFLADGERVQLFQPSGIQTLPASGTTSIFARLIEVNYNPDPSINPSGATNVASGLNAADLSFQPVEQYNLLDLTITSGATYIKLGDVTTLGGLITQIDYTNRQNLKIGEIDLFAGTINGQIIQSGTINSSAFTNPLTSDLNLGSGVNINYLGSGNNQIASYTTPLGAVFAVSGTFHDISGFSPILIDGLVQKSGTSLESAASNLNVSIDTQNRGVKVGGGMILNQNSIDLNSITNPANANLLIATAPAASVNFSTNSINSNGDINLNNADLNIFSGNVNISNGTLNVSAFAVNNLSVGNAISGNLATTGDFAVGGNLVFSGTAQGFDNLITNGKMFPSGTTVSGTSTPLAWSATNPDANFIMGPLGTAVSRFMTFPAALNTATQGLTEYTMEWVFQMKNAGSISRLYAANAASPSQPRFEVVGGRLYYYNQSAGNFGLGNGFVVWTNPGTIVSNRFYHAALVASGSTTKLWLDGIQPIANSSNLSYGANFPSSITNQNIGLFSVGDSGIDGGLELKGFKISNKAATVFPSGLVNLTVDANTIALYDFNNVPSGVDKSGFGRNLLFMGNNPSGMSFYEAPAPSGTAVSGLANFLGQSLSGSTVLDYTQDTKQAGTINIFSGETNSPYYYQISGSNITNRGITLSTPLNIENSKTYNLSYYTKLISGTAVNLIPPFSNAIGVNAYVSGTGYVSPVFSGTIGSEWGRNVIPFTSPATGSNFSLYINAFSPSGNTISGVSLIGLSSVQATKGTALLAPVATSPKSISIVHSNINQRQFSSTVLGAANANVVTYFSGTVFSEGGIATIAPQLSYLAVKWFNGDSQGYWLIPNMLHTVTLNGVEIIRQSFLFQGVSSTNPYYTMETTKTWTGYLPRGSNQIVSKMSLIYAGDSATCRWLMDPTDVPKTYITMF